MAFENVGDSIIYTTNQHLIIPVSGLYKLECYGERGGTATNTWDAASGGNGGYVCGYVKLKKGDVIYLRPVTVKSKRWVPSGQWIRAAGNGGQGAYISKTDTTYADTADEDYYLVAGGGGGGVKTQGTSAIDNGIRYTGRPGGYDNNVLTSGFVGEDAYDLAGGGGSGYRGGKAGKPANGGSNYIGGVPSINYKGVIYDPISQAGVSTVNKCVVTLVDILTPPVYLGDIKIAGIYLGDRAMADIK